MNKFSHTIGSHSDDRGGALDALCPCQDNKSTNTKDELEQEITNIFITIDNYGTAEEARVDIRKLLAKERQQLIQRIRNEVIGEDEALYVASPPIMLPVASNPHKVVEVEYQREKMLREMEAYKIIMAKSQLRQTQREILETMEKEL